MPFLLLGVGIDDMFVIVQSLNTLSGENIVASDGPIADLDRGNAVS